MTPHATNAASLDATQLYRLPWTLTDNVLGWLEPTKRCNLYCEGCYSRNDPNSDKTLEQVREDLKVFTSKRKLDSISIAGGDPLIHPRIVEIVRMIRSEFGLKPIINTNGLALQRQLLRELKEAGVAGFTFHVDSSQHRPHWKEADELELCQLRLRLARMVADAGELSVSFNATIFPHTLKHVPALVRWAQENIELVHSMVFILFRTTLGKKFDYYAGERKVEQETELVYHGQDQAGTETPLHARDIVRTVQEHEPDFSPSAYLGGTRDPESLKWLLAVRAGRPDGILGYLGPAAMEAAQVGHHALTGRYFAYSKPSTMRLGMPALTAMASIDKGARGILRARLAEGVRHPMRKTKPLHLQSIVVIQPIDMMADGQANMCDGCPDMTVHDGKLVWSCRLDEKLQYGCFLNAVPRGGAAPAHDGEAAPVQNSEAAPAQNG